MNICVIISITNNMDTMKVGKNTVTKYLNLSTLWISVVSFANELDFATGLPWKLMWRWYCDLLF